jgi:SAM-dependent methyltransferase
VIRATADQRLAAWASSQSDHRPEHQPVAQAVQLTLATIGSQNSDDVAEVLSWLAARDHHATAVNADDPRQRHDVEVRVASFSNADEIATALSEFGFERWERWTGAAGESFRRHADQLTVARTRDHSFVLRLRWGATHAPGRLTRVFRPTRGDWDMVALPLRLWRAYSLVRPLRLLLERLGLRDPHESGLGPFLATPASLMPALFDVAEIGPDDVVVDIGCGDGRLVAAAASQFGCRGIGVEQDANLVDLARERARSTGVDHLVTIEHADARAVDLSEGTVALVFLPMDVVPAVVTQTLAALPTGARLVIHEQTPLPSNLAVPPDRSVAVIAENAITIAHRWTA